MSDDELEKRTSDEVTCNPYAVCGIDIYMTQEAARQEQVQPDFRKQFTHVDAEAPFYFVARHYQITSLLKKSANTVPTIHYVPETLREFEAIGVATRKDAVLQFTDDTIAIISTPLRASEIRYLIAAMNPREN